MIKPATVLSALTKLECQKLYDLALNKTVLELGSQYGGSTISMAKSAKVIHAVDWHKGDENAGFLGNTAIEYLTNINEYKVEHKIVTHIGRFSDVLPLFREDSFDLVFVDGCHTEEATKECIELTKRRIKNNGIWAFHDYGVFPGVQKAINDLMGPIDELVDTLAVVNNRL